MTSEPIEARIGELFTTLRSLSFTTQVSESVKNVARVAIRDPGMRHNVYPVWNSWAVRYYFAGKQRTFFTTDDPLAAFRIADMLIHRFADLRTKRFVPSEESYNLTPEQAKADLEAEQEIYSVLLQIHSLAPDKPKQSRAGEKHRTVRSEFAEMKAQLDRIEQKLNELGPR